MKKQSKATKIAFKSIKKRMDELDISEAKLAKAIGINKSTLSRNLKGEFEMSLTNYFKICEHLSCIYAERNVSLKTKES